MLAAKSRTLTAAGAQITATNSAADPSAASAAQSSLVNGSTKPVEVKYPLRVSQRTCLEADLSQRGWTAALEAEGWNPQVLIPTVPETHIV